MTEEEDLCLELAGLVADLAGFVDPTPTSDAVSAGISFWRGDVTGGLISLVGIVPYIGDLAKFGKLPKYLDAVRSAVRLAVKDARFAQKIRPLLHELKAILSKIPADLLPRAVVHHINELKAELNAIKEAIPSHQISAMIENIQIPKLRKMVSEALSLPALRNPRALAKHPGPITEARLVEELTSKEFKQIKQGTHGPGGTPRYGGTPEDSDVYLRRIKGEGGQDFFEAVRIDKHTPNPALGNPQLKSGSTKNYQNPRGEIRPWDNMKPSARQADAKGPHRLHHSLKDTNTPADWPKHVTEGRARKADFSHWHRETFPATDDNLVQYLQGGSGIKGLQKFDPMGQPVRSLR